MSEAAAKILSNASSMILERSWGFMVAHGPSSAACRAAPTARSTSSAPATATRPEDPLERVEHDPGALLGLHGRPRPLVGGLPGGPDGALDVLGAGHRHPPRRFPRGGVRRVDGLPGGGVHELPADEQLVLAHGVSLSAHGRR